MNHEVRKLVLHLNVLKEAANARIVIESGCVRKEELKAVREEHDINLLDAIEAVRKYIDPEHPKYKIARKLD